MLFESNCSDYGVKKIECPLTTKDLLVLCQLFYLPSEHGVIGVDLLNEFYWLKRNGTAMLPQGKLQSCF
jgi:hypothetical protein